MFTGSIRPETLARFTVPVNVLLVVLLAHGLSVLTWDLIPQPEPTPNGITGVNSRAPAADGSRAANFGVISDWHLFGRVQAVKPVVQQAASAPETKLNLRLAGVFYTPGDGTPLALISAGGGDEISYTTDSELPGGARVQQILRDRVVLSRSGALETLSLPNDSGDGGAELIERVAPPAPVAPNAGNGGGGDAQTMDVSTLADRFRPLAWSQPENLQDLAYVTPYVRDGAFAGFRLRPGREPRLFEELGLQNGDVVTVIDGVRIEDASQGLQLLQDISQADEVSVQVLRGGSEIPFTFVLNRQR